MVFGTDEFLELCRQLETDPMIVLAAPSTRPEDVEYAMNWVHYLLDPATTFMGKNACRQRSSTTVSHSLYPGR
jgi:alpha-N-arabinofuranosidase